MKDGVHIPAPDPELDLVLERVVEVSPERVWAAWTRPEQLQQWFAPRPWSVSECDIDLRPGGTFRTVMRSPDGEEHPGAGCYLAVEESRLLIWTDALEPGFRPAAEPFFTAIITMEPHPRGTQYTVRAVHGKSADREKHEEMGFHEGWGRAFEQMLEVMEEAGGAP